MSGVRTYTVISIRADHAATVYMSEDGSWLAADFSDSTPISTLALEFQMNEYGLSRAEVLEKYNLISNGPNKYWYGSFDIWLEYNPYFFPNGHFSKKVELPKFTDVASGSWYHNYVYGVLDTGLMIGSNGMFNPNKNLSIDELVTVAVRLHAKENLATIRSANNGEHWSTPYKEYAIKNAIVDSSFVKDGTRKATREELAYALYGAKTPIKTREAVYTVEDVTPKYQQAVLVMHEAEILNGVGNSL